MINFVSTGACTRSLGRLTVGLSAAVGLLLATPGSGSAAEAGVLTTSGPANVANTGQCWDLGSNQPGAEVVMVTCHYEDTYSSQKWYRTINSPTVFNIQNSNNLCLDLRSNAVGAHVIMAPCHYEDTYTSQKWYQDGDRPRHFRNANGLCMDRPTNIGGPIVMTRCNYDVNFQSQRWWTTGAW
ncbi:RICIN domain-containing protein [Streptomyces sp. NPDC048243]|uniref:RICIN domain-containing protein n=2 Tax=Streptomyces TaxID=1883 RepID=UPI003717AF56